MKKIIFSLILLLFFNISYQFDYQLLLNDGYEKKTHHFGGKQFFKKTDFGSDTQVFLPEQNQLNFPSIFNTILNPSKKQEIDDAITQCSHGNKPDFFKFAGQSIAVLGKERQQTVQIQSDCFQKTTLTYTRVDTLTATVEIDAEEPKSLLCSDLYLFGTPSNFHMENVFFRGKHLITFNKLTYEQFQYIENWGLHVFKLCDSLINLVPDLLMTAGLFLGGFSTNPNIPIFGSKPTWYMEYLNPLFIKHATGFQWQKRANPKLIDLDPSFVHSGDYLAITRMDGVDQIIQYGTGSHSGHSAVALWIDGELYVVESQDGWYWPKHGIQRNKWKDWIQNANNAGFNVALLPLSKESRQKFNESAAVEFFKQLEFTPYGYHNFLFSWIDTPNENFPPILDIDFISLAFVLIEKISPSTVSMFLGEAMNKRLNTTGLSFHDVILKGQEQNKSVADLMAVVEEEGWEYSDGKSYVCSCFVTGIWKSAGIFGDLKIHSTEFTPRDIYQLDIFDKNYTKPDACQGVDDDLPYCQLMGKFKMELPGFNTIQPYNHMNEKCPGLPPNYSRVEGC